jgi:hypothetical protein
VWRQLALAEAELRRGERVGFDRLDLDGDGFEEIWVHSAAFSGLVSPHRGGAVEEYVLFRTGLNYAAALTRRREAYHELTLEASGEGSVPEGDAAPSIHDIEKGIRLDRLPPVDRETRALFVDRVLPAALTSDAYASGAYEPLASWASASLQPEVRATDDAVEVTCRTAGFEKRLHFDAAGGLRATYRWDPAAYPQDAVFAPEFTLGHPLELQCTPQTEVWSFPVATVSKSERGLEETVQGRALTPRWRVGLGEAQIALRPVPAS